MFSGFGLTISSVVNDPDDSLAYTYTSIGKLPLIDNYVIDPQTFFTIKNTPNRLADVTLAPKVEENITISRDESDPENIINAYVLMQRDLNAKVFQKYQYD